jgi:hypothetical protein
MTAVTSKDEAETQPQSAAAPSPFPPIADYAFLSNCHTGALVAPDGAIDWLCIPSFDSPSVFGSLLDREAGFFRFGPFGIAHPTARAYEPGTNVLATTWKTPSGWLLVLDALTMGPWDHEDQITPHTRPPADDDADHMLVRTVECVSLRSTTAARRPTGRWRTVTGTPRTRAERANSSAWCPISPLASRATAFVDGTCSTRATARTARSPGPKGSPRRRTSTRPGRG